MINTAPSKPVMPEPDITIVHYPDDYDYFSPALAQSHHEAWSLYCASLEADRERMREALVSALEYVQVWYRGTNLHMKLIAALAPLKKEPTNEST